MKNKTAEQSLLKRLWNKRIMAPVRLIVKMTKRNMDKNIRFAIIVVFSICLFFAGVAFMISNTIFGHNQYRTVTIVDRTAIANMKKSFEDSYASYTKDKFSSIKSNDMNSIIMNMDLVGNRRIAVADFEGNVLYKYGNITDAKIDISKTMKIAEKTCSEDKVSRNYFANLSREELVSFSNIKFNDQPAIVFYYTDAEVTNKDEYYNSGISMFSVMIAVIVFAVSFLKLTKDKMKYLNDISTGLSTIADGNLNYRINEVGNDEISRIAKNINNMAREIERRMQQERRAEKTKNDLITNVSHDLRTPLTSVMGYLGLIKERKYADMNQMEEYINIAFVKSQKIKVLMEDLFEYTKLSNNMITLKKQKIDINEFLSQLIEEYIPVFEENSLNVVRNMDKNIFVNIDVDKMLRVFENMFSNAVKYASKPCDFKIGISDKDKKVQITFANRSEFIPKEKIDRLFDRFYRVDDSRNSVKSAGSGLGLAISKHIVELHKGRIWAEYVDDKIIFIIELNKIK